MGLYDSDSSNCKRHPNQKQQPGVCPSCLREKLSMLSNTPFIKHRKSVVVSHSSSLSSTPPYSSATSSSSAAAVSRNRHRRNGSDACVVSVGSVLIDGLKKSRSVSCAPLSRSRGGSTNNNNNNNNNRSNNRIGKIFDGDSNNKNGGIEEKDGSTRRKKGGFLKRLIKKT